MNPMEVTVQTLYLNVYLQVVILNLKAEYVEVIHVVKKNLVHLNLVNVFVRLLDGNVHVDISKRHQVVYNQVMLLFITKAHAQITVHMQL